MTLSYCSTAALPADAAKSLNGRKQDGVRETALMDELAWMRRFFYGLHLISCEDIGLKPSLLDGEVPDARDCFKTAEDDCARRRGCLIERQFPLNVVKLLALAKCACSAKQQE